MRRRPSGSLGAQANAAVSGVAGKIDGQAVEVAGRVVRVVVPAVRALRVPTALVLYAPLPFIAATWVLGALADGSVAFVVLLAAALMTAVSAAFWGRRRRILQAVEEPDKLATELTIMISLTDKVDETRGALSEVAGGGGWRVFGRLRGAWRGVSMTGRWIEQVGDLPRARYFAPPKIGTTVTVTVAALWLVPLSVVVSLFALIGTVAGSL